MQATINKTSLHSAFVVDEAGISTIFADLKQTLVLQHHATLIYLCSGNNFIFESELEILQKRHPSQFILFLIREKRGYGSLQELLEAIINSNTKDNLVFILSGNEEHIHIASNQLYFLGIGKNEIKIY